MASKKGFLNEIFAMEYLSWCKAGKLPASASDMAQNVLKLQKEKMLRYHVSKKVEPEIGKENEVSKYNYLSPNVSTRQSEHFLSIIRQDLFFRRLTFMLHGEVAYTAYQKDVLVTTATNLKNGTKSDSNWPRITDFYIFPHKKLSPVSSQGEYLLILFPCIIFTFLYLGYLFGLFGNFSFFPFLYSLFGACLFGLILSFLVWMPYKMFTMMHKAKKGLRNHVPQKRNQRKLYQLMISEDATFDYAYFYNHLMMMLQAIIYAEGKASFPFYQESSPVAGLENIIELEGDQSLKVCAYHKEADAISLTLKVGIITYRATEESVQRKTEHLKIELEKDLTIDDELSYPFRICRITPV